MLRKWLVRLTVVITGLVALLMAAMWFMMSDFGGHVGVVEKTVVSRDGTTIAYAESGARPKVVVVAATLADRSGATKVARHLGRELQGHQL